METKKHSPNGQHCGHDNDGIYKGIGIDNPTYKLNVNPKKQTAVMQLINFILNERRQEDGSIKFHAHEDFSIFLQIEKEQILEALNYDCYRNDYPESYYEELYGN